MEGEDIASIKEIAELAGVSKSTVSIILNGKAKEYRISEATQAKVHKAAQQLDYKPNISAKRLRTSGETVKPIIALFWTVDARTQLINRFLKAIQHTLNESGNEYELLIQPYVGSRLCDETSLLTGTRFNGAIIANATVEDELFLANTDISVPTVLYLRDSDKYCCVNIDHYKAGKEVAALFAARGHRRIGVVIPSVSSHAIDSRGRGFMDGCAEFDLDLPENRIVYDQYTEEGGYLAARTLAACSERPSAVFFLSDQMAIGGLHGFHELGISIPGDIEIIGHDNESASRYSIPSLTTMHLPVEEMASACFKLIVDLMDHKLMSPQSQKFDYYLAVRQSCGAAVEH
ncbi:LacI family DNA-binding transcriptional regulator [Paenibacillus sp. HB172176]|uniref:LacI family DNA-binding transcriptional regulator n=1 Tax=Paenibacillus sp. HB172176 TaxID=2493690 RepID=UPI001F1065A4|nr:LacI family DNA-binding transcriptional regulator [Paenibacillus sp. HB172176]